MELSIVLVIIGLLMGGILVGNSMVASLTINGYVNKLVAYEVIFNNFKVKYKQLPGDSRAFTPAGDANGFVDANAGCSGNYSNNESAQIWAHMTQAGMLGEKFIPYTPVGCGAGIHSSSYSHASLINITHPYFATRKAAYPGRSGIRHVKVSNKWDTFGSAVYPIEAVAVDKKIDNGNNSNGRFRSFENNSSLGPCDQLLENDAIICYFYYYLTVN